MQGPTLNFVFFSVGLERHYIVLEEHLCFTETFMLLITYMLPDSRHRKTVAVYMLT
jgi:hypothetical protein